MDSVGSIRSRRGRVRESVREYIDSIFRAGVDRYGSALGVLYTGPDLATQLSDELSGRVAYAAAQDLTWIMSPGAQLCHPGGVEAVRKWLPDAPEGTITVTPVDEVTVPIANFESSGEGWTVTRWVDGEGRVDPNSETILTNAGTVSVTTGTTTVTGTSTAFDVAMIGAVIRIDGPTTQFITTVADVASTTSLELTDPFGDYDATDVTFTIVSISSASAYVTGIDSNAIEVTANPAGRWQVAADFAGVDTTFGNSEANDADTFRLWLSADNPAAIVAVRVTLLNGSGEDRPAQTATIPASAINRVENGWTQIQISRRANPFALVEANEGYRDLNRRLIEAQEAGRSLEADELLQQRNALFDELIKTAPPFFRSAAVSVADDTAFAFDWSAITGMFVEVELSEAAVFRLDKAEFAGRVPGALSGHWTFYLSYSTDDGHETLASAESATTHFENQRALLSGLPVSVEDQVTVKHIYGIGPGVDQPLRFATILNHITTFLLDVDVRSVQDSAVQMPEDADPPPAASGLVPRPYMGRLIAYNVEGKEARIYWTPKDKPWKFPGSSDDTEGNWFDAGAHSDAIMAITDHSRMLVVYKQQSIWRILGDPDLDGVEPERTAAGIGAAGPRCVTTGGGVDWVLGTNGVYLFDGQVEKLISLPIAPIFRGEWAEMSTEMLLPPIDHVYIGESVMAYRDQKVYLSYPSSGSSTPDTTLVYDTTTQMWARDTGGYTCLFDEGPGAYLMGGNATGLYALEAGDDDAGDPIAVKWQTPSFNQGAPQAPKVYGEIVIEFKSPDALTVKALYDDDDLVALDSIFGAERSVKRIPLGDNATGRQADRIAILIEGDIRQEAVIYSVYIHYYVEARKSQVFDSGIIDFGGAARVIGLEFDISGAGPLLWAIDTDNFEGMVQEQTRDALTGVEFRHTDHVRVRTRPQGKRGRVRVWSPGDVEFQVHALRVSLEMFPVGLGPSSRWESLVSGN